MQKFTVKFKFMVYKSGGEWGLLCKFYLERLVCLDSFMGMLQKKAPSALFSPSSRTFTHTKSLFQKHSPKCPGSRGRSVVFHARVLHLKLQKGFLTPGLKLR